MKYLNLASLLLALSAITGCSDDTEQFIVPDTGDGISVSYRVEGEMVLSRGVPTTAHERTLDHVHVIFIDAETDAYAGYTRAAVTAGKTKFSLDPPESLVEDKSYKVLAVGNGDDYCDDAESFSAKLAGLSGTLTDIKDKLIAHCSKNITKNSVDALPLYGMFLDKEGTESTFTVTKENGVRKVAEAESAEFVFSRAICRVDIHNLVGHVLDIRYARVANNRTSGYYFVDGLNAGTVAEMTTAITDPSTSDIYMPVTADMVEGSTTQKLEASLYTFPNLVAASAQNDKATTCLLIAGYYVDPESGQKDDRLTFYRFNLANVGESQALQRNYAYRATIKGVKRRGSENEKDAYNDNIPIFEYQVDDEWDATDDNVVSDADGNFLIVNKTHFTFNGEASEADFVELRVSTNPELQWHVEEVNREDQQNDRFIFKKISNTAVQLGPKEQNTTDYVRYGYYKIVAESPTIKKPLKMYIYMLQMSTKDNVRMLTVNGNTGTFTQEIPADGANISLKVVTGSKFNTWATVIHGEDIANWSSDAFYTKEGTNNGYLTLNIPAHIGTETRTTEIEVYLVDKNESDGKDKNVKPVTVVISQEPTDRWFSISPDPGDGIMLDAFSLEPGNPNGVPSHSSRKFTVTLKDPTLKYKVTTSFNQLIDLRITPDNNLEEDNTEYGRSIPALIPKYSRDWYPAKDREPTDEKWADYVRKVTGLKSGQSFWLNPFRTGPGDPSIKGTVTVIAYPSSGEVDDPASRLTFNVEIKNSDDYVLNDIIVGNLLIADRNVGHNARVRDDADKYPFGSSEGRRDALNYTHAYYPPFIGTSDNSVYITGKSKSEMNEEYNDIAKHWKYNDASSNYAQYLQSFYEYWAKYHSDQDGRYSPFYKEENKDKWRLPQPEEWNNLINNRVIFTKWRTFMVSDIKTMKNGKDIPTMCWLHQSGGSMGGYGSAIAIYMSMTKSTDTEVKASNFSVTALQDYDTSINPPKFVTATANYANDATVRLVRELTDEEIASYKTNYLGY